MREDVGDCIWASREPDPRRPGREPTSRTSARSAPTWGSVWTKTSVRKGSGPRERSRPQLDSRLLRRWVGTEVRCAAAQAEEAMPHHPPGKVAKCQTRPLRSLSGSPKPTGSKCVYPHTSSTSESLITTLQRILTRIRTGRTHSQWEILFEGRTKKRLTG